MKRKAEEPAGHLLMSSPPVFEPGEPGEGMSNYDVFIAGRSVVLPLDPPDLPGPPGPPRKEGHSICADWKHCTQLVGLMEQIMDRAQNVGKREVVEINLGWESPGVLLADVFNPQHRTHDREVGECVEATQGRRCCKLLQPLSNRHFAIGDFDTADEEVEAIYNEGGVEVDQRHCREVVQGRQTDRSIQRCPERP